MLGSGTLRSCEFSRRSCSLGDSANEALASLQQPGQLVAVACASAPAVVALVVAAAAVVAGLAAGLVADSVADLAADLVAVVGLVALGLASVVVLEPGPAAAVAVAVVGSD